MTCRQLPCQGPRLKPSRNRAKFPRKAQGIRQGQGSSGRDQQKSWERVPFPVPPEKGEVHGASKQGMPQGRCPGSVTHAGSWVRSAPARTGRSELPGSWACTRTLPCASPCDRRSLLCQQRSNRSLERSENNNIRHLSKDSTGWAGSWSTDQRAGNS